MCSNDIFTKLGCKITIKIPHTQKNFKIICTIQKKVVLLHPISRRDGRVVDCGGLENR